MTLKLQHLADPIFQSIVEYIHTRQTSLWPLLSLSYLIYKKLIAPRRHPVVRTYVRTYSYVHALNLLPKWRLFWLGPGMPFFLLMPGHEKDECYYRTTTHTHTRAHICLTSFVLCTIYAYTLFIIQLQQLFIELLRIHAYNIFVVLFINSYKFAFMIRFFQVRGRTNPSLHAKEGICISCDTRCTTYE